MKNNVELVGESFRNIGEDWVKILFNLQYNFDLHQTEDIVRYLNNGRSVCKWELDNVGHEYNAILLRGKHVSGDIKYLIMEKEK